MGRDKKLPALQFYPGDWRKAVDVQSLSYHDRGVWFEMLMLMHDSEQRGVMILNGTAMTDEMVARSLGLDNQTFNQTLTTLLTFGVASREPNSGAIMCRRMVRDENLRKVRTEAGSKGGNPRLLNQKTTSRDKQKSTPSSSSSLSSSEEKALVERTFAYFCKKLKRDPSKYTLTKQRMEKAVSRLRERLKSRGEDVDAVTEEFRVVVDNLAASSFHREHGHTDWIDQIFRSAEEFEKRLTWQGQAGTVPTQPSEPNAYQQRLAAMKAEMGAVNA